MHLLNPNDMVVIKSSEGEKHSKKERKELLEVHYINLTVIIFYYYTHNNQAIFLFLLYFHQHSKSKVQATIHSDMEKQQKEKELNGSSREEN